MSERSLESIYPTLFIGMGGAGGQVLGLLSRLFADEFGPEIVRSGASPLQFLLLDTDDFEKLPDEVKKNLHNPERDFLSLSNFNPRKYAERQLQMADSDLPRWFDRDAIPYLEDTIIHDGASRLRMLGRLCLHYRYHEVEQRIREKLDAALDITIHAQARRIRPEPRPLRIYFIASSLGGTGSAIFIDVAAMANRIARDHGITPDVQGFVFLPFAFIKQNAGIDAALEAFYQHNAWAFFSELNHLLRHPEQLPEYVLDPHRPANRLPRPFDYGRDLFRTIYLLGENIPPAGVSDLKRLYAQTAHGLFHVFLTPEEDNVRSTYSNIKTKLKETDRKFGDIKRFATFGYAEYRVLGHRYGDHLAWEATRRDWQRLLGSEPSSAQVDASAVPIIAAAESIITDAVSKAKDLDLDLPTADDLLDGQSSAAQIIGIIQDQPKRAQAKIDKRIQALDHMAFAASLRTDVENQIRSRISDPPLGLVGEVEVLKRAREILYSRAEELRNPPNSADADSEISQLIDTLIDEVKSTTSGFTLSFWKRKPLTDEFAAPLAKLQQMIQKRATDQLVAKTQQALAAALRPLVQPQGRIEHYWTQLGAAASMMGKYEIPFEAESNSVSASTIQRLPTLDMLVASTNARIDHFYSTKTPVLRATRMALWSYARPHLMKGDTEALQAFCEGLKHEWLTHAREEIGALDSEELLRKWGTHSQAMGIVEETNGTPPADPLKRLYPLSYPACPLDPSVLHKDDTVPKVAVAVGPFEKDEEAKQKLGVPGTLQRGPRRSDRIAVLQTWYAFASRAVEGMETLRRSYQDRQRKISLPHITREWNRNNFGETSDGTARFSDEDLLHVSRALALSRHFPSSKWNGAAAPEPHIERDTRDREPFYLLEYGIENGRSRLRWRDLHPVDGYSNRWRLVHAASESTNGNGSANTGWDPERDLGAYLVSDARQRHAEFLRQLTQFELPMNGKENGGEKKSENEYIGAYRKYLDHLSDLAEREKKSGRKKYLPLLVRISDVLHGYVEQLTAQDDPLL